MTKLDAIFGKNLVSIRKAKGFSSADSFAEYAGVSLRALQRYETGKRMPSSEKIEDFAEKLGVQVQDFFRVDEALVIQRSAPVSIVAKKMVAIPDDIYDLALDLGDLDSEVWNTLRDAIEIKLEKRKKEAHRGRQA